MIVQCKNAFNRKNICVQLLFRAAVFNRDDIISFLLDNGVGFDTRDTQSNTPFLDAVAAGQTRCARVLLQRGADVKASDIFMKNCIHLAVENENLETLQMLLEENSVLSNLYRPDVNERVPLHYAATVKDIRVCMAIVIQLFFSLSIVGYFLRGQIRKKIHVKASLQETHCSPSGLPCQWDKREQI